MTSVRFVCKRYNFGRALTEIVKICDVCDIVYKDNAVSFVCSFFCASKVKKILLKFNIEILSCKSLGLANFFSLKKLGVVIGIVLGSIFWFVSTFFVCNVKVVGDFEFTRNEVYGVINKYGLQNINLKSRINTQKIENSLYQLNYISYASVIVVGNSVLINVREQLVSRDFVECEKHSPIISNYNGVVSSFTLLQGTAKVKKGDLVKIGDVLVEPFSVSGSGEVVSVQPLAKICVDVYFTETRTIYKNTLHLQRSGKSICDYKIECLGATLFEKAVKCSYEKFETQQSVVNLTTTLLPLIKRKITYFELVFVEDIDEKSLIECELEKLCATNLQKLNKCDIIEETTTFVEESDDFFVITATSVVNKKIC